MSFFLSFLIDFFFPLFAALCLASKPRLTIEVLCAVDGRSAARIQTFCVDSAG